MSEDSQKKEKAKAKRRHRSGYPTPGFYLFSFLLNMISLLVSSSLLLLSFQMNLLVFAIVALIGVIVSVYSFALRPKESNKKLRKILVAFTALYGLAVLASIGFTALQEPYIFI